MRNSYVGRLSIYSVAAICGSAVGSSWTRRSAVWANANPITAGVPAALVSLGPALVIVAVERLGVRATASVCAGVAASMVVMWFLFATNESSTSSFVFFWGWLAGIPAAAAVSARAITNRKGTNRKGTNRKAHR